MAAVLQMLGLYHDKRLRLVRHKALLNFRRDRFMALEMAVLGLKDAPADLNRADDKYLFVLFLSRRNKLP